MPGDPSLSIIPRDPKFRGFRDYIISFFGLDRSQWEQFVVYLQKLVTFDWGISYLPAPRRGHPPP
jgi:ABC-type dipeptide/oligopeptide/nickel transport system permease component